MPRSKRLDDPPSDTLTTFRSGFKRSRKGNWWRTWPLNGVNVTVTVFRRDDDERYVWCIADSDGPHYSADSFETEDAAVSELLVALTESEGAEPG